MDYSQYNLEKTGYLKEDFRLFHICLLYTSPSPRDS